LAEVDAQKDNTDAQQDIGMNSNISVEGNKEQHEDTTTHISPSQAAMVNHNIDVSTHSFSMQLTNVTDDVDCSDLGADHEPILSPVRTLDVSSIAAAPDALVDPTLQNEMDFMQTWLEKTAVNDAPFSSNISKSQKKKMNMAKASYQTRSHGPLPHPQ